MPVENLCISVPILRTSGKKNAAAQYASAAEDNQSEGTYRARRETAKPPPGAMRTDRESAAVTVRRVI